MRALRILIAQTCTDILAAALAQAVRGDPRVYLCEGEVIESEHVEAQFRKPNDVPQVLVMIGKAQHVERRARQLTAAHRDLVVVRFDPAEELAHIDFRQLSLDGLMEILRCVAFRREEDAWDDAGELLSRLLQPIQAHPIIGSPRAAPKTGVAGSSADLRAAVLHAAEPSVNEVQK